MEKSLNLLVAVAWAAVVSIAVQAAPVSIEQARLSAQRFVMSGNAKFTAQSGNVLSLAHEAKSPDGMTDYFVFNRGERGGFVVVAGDDRVQPVWGYCENGSFDLASMPENVKWWFSEYQRQMRFLRANPKVSARKKVDLDKVVAPLLTTRWSQCRPYNDLCPEAQSDDDPYLVYGGRACTGCVATATAQVMNYWQWPMRGRGAKGYDCEVTYYNSEKGYSDSRDETLSVDFSQSVYRWDLMKNEYLYADKNNRGYFDEDRHVVIHVIDENGDTIADSNGMHGNAVAKLMSDVGIAVEMGYGYNGSGASSYLVYYSLFYNFRYLVGYASRDDGDDEDWDASLREELDAGRPVYYSGHGYQGGHAFVFDGYDSEGRFHVNWGWGGSYDGYFESLSLDPNGYYFNSYQEMVCCMPYRPLTSYPVGNTTVDFGIVPQDSAVVRVIKVSGMYLDENLKVSITGEQAENFLTEVRTIPATAVNDDGGFDLEVVYYPWSDGSHMARLTISTDESDAYGDAIEPITFILKGRLGNPCDVNLDGEVNVADANRVIDMILSASGLDLAGDVNGDGEINLADVNAVITAILNN